jgi:8-oxo-dGTP diphosphatase
MSIRLAGCVIFDKDRKIYLLHRNKKGVTQWELPGGKVEAGESDEQAAVRELKEELGVDVKIIVELGNTEFNEGDAEFSYVWFLAEIKKGNPKIKEPESFDDLKSFAFDEMTSLKLSGNMQKFYAAVSNKSIKIKV